ncbi:MAG: protein-L-isoaspartate(D-aspartate) O-methyltransferase [Ignavibacteria bacterium]|nr:protein-L-isoaspartate(D-aspartate) O-methyltransferase [Ignavibacteria bacterium]
MSKQNNKITSPLGVQRTVLVKELRSKGISDTNVLRAIETVHREAFLPAAMVSRAYEDTALPIDNKQTISQPYTVASMTQALRLEPQMKVLEIGTGSGYQAAILAEMGMHVFTIERHPILSQKAREVLAREGYNVNCRIGDGTIGYSAQAPYDAIIVTAGAPDVPETLAKQLKIGGRLAVPVGDKSSQQLYVVTRTADEKWDVLDLGPYKFVPLIGIEGWEDGR